MYVKVIWLDFIHVGHHAVSCASQKPKPPTGCKSQAPGCGTRDVCKILYNLKPVKVDGGTDGTDMNEVGG